ncbi:hypothetical protein QG053_01460 [Kingella kingae]|uniref:Uncharacterized protein n=1 Tax=Kingella negevensis TaxID=1522312 RepID=A0A238HE44_9NEIS|nr:MULTISPECIES: hypothetical protein [Kingella]MDK4563731.1 hypothetical protein [Kingella kingae]MDK4578334.1 hypothetical protein [Kingella kingae]MDK4608382.1 hypothetical protein [Kingella kingae]MDK4625734.1 hypothetical protein [Kingella kingae]MDK4673556.1 hypothetical protein [Kingella kingae]
MVDLHKIRQEMSPNVAKIDAVKLLKLFFCSRLTAIICKWRLNTSMN